MNKWFLINKDGYLQLKFGKYKYKFLSQIPDDYLKWILEEHKKSNQFPKILLEGIKTELTRRKRKWRLKK